MGKLPRIGNCKNPMICSFLRRLHTMSSGDGSNAVVNVVKTKESSEGDLNVTKKSKKMQVKVMARRNALKGAERAEYYSIRCSTHSLHCSTIFIACMAAIVFVLLF